MKERVLVFERGGGVRGEKRDGEKGRFIEEAEENLVMEEEEEGEEQRRGEKDG